MVSMRPRPNRLPPLKMIGLVLVVAATGVAGQDPAAPQPGPVSLDDIPEFSLRVGVVAGDHKAAHKAFLAAHKSHKAGDAAAARDGYLRFLGMPGRHQLPERYRRMARARIDAMVASSIAAYQLAAKTYAKDRAAGLVALGAVAQVWGRLPGGRRARALAHSDALTAAVAAAKSLRGTDAKRAAKELESAVRACPEAVRLYGAKSLLIEIGGPDLRTAQEKEHLGADPDQKADRKDEKGDEPTIEIGDG